MGMLTTKLTLISGDIDVITTINSYINISFIFEYEGNLLGVGVIANRISRTQDTSN